METIKPTYQEAGDLRTCRALTAFALGDGSDAQVGDELKLPASRALRLVGLGMVEIMLSEKEAAR